MVATEQNEGKMKEHEIKVVWREYYNEAAIKQLEAMGTLPRNESMIDCRWCTGAEVAALVAEDAYRQDSEQFREGGDLVILEPEEFAGSYEIGVDYEPVFHAYAA